MQKTSCCEDLPTNPYPTHLPAVLGDEEAEERSQYERSDARATDADAGRQCPSLVEIEADHHDRRKVHQTEPDTCHHRCENVHIIIKNVNIT